MFGDVIAVRENILTRKRRMRVVLKIAGGLRAIG